jgi:diaminopimelate epimerase
MAIPFTKASACGNDFLIIDGALAPPDISAFTQRICDRHNGVGADGVEWLFPARDADVEARLINADGSGAEISGNGTRCVAAHLTSERGQGSVIVRTGAGLRTCTLTARRGNGYEFETAMGVPEVGRQVALETSWGAVEGTPVSMGNPHFVIFVDAFWPQWPARAASMQAHPHFKRGVNIELVLVQDKSNIEVRFFERGVGETQSSGTGSCAGAVAAIARRGCHSPLQVHARGGPQFVRFEHEVFLRGPAELLCRGEFFV